MPAVTGSSPVGFTMMRAECYGGPRDGDCIKVPDDPTYFVIPKRLEMASCMEENFMDTKLILGTYVWNNKLIRWEWEGWGDDVPKQYKSS